MQAAGRQSRAADAELERAKHVDESADRAAVAAGKELPNTRASVAAAEAARLAARRRDAASAHYRGLMHEYASEVARRRGFSVKELESTIKAMQDNARDLLNQLTRVIDAIQAERWTLGALREFPPQGSLMSIRFRPDDRLCPGRGRTQPRSYNDTARWAATSAGSSMAGPRCRGRGSAPRQCRPACRCPRPGEPS